MSQSRRQSPLRLWSLATLMLASIALAACGGDGPSAASATDPVACASALETDLRTALSAAAEHDAPVVIFCSTTIDASPVDSEP